MANGSTKSSAAAETGRVRKRSSSSVKLQQQNELGYWAMGKLLFYFLSYSCLVCLLLFLLFPYVKLKVQACVWSVLARLNSLSCSRAASLCPSLDQQNDDLRRKKDTKNRFSVFYVNCGPQAWNSSRCCFCCCWMLLYYFWVCSRQPSTDFFLNCFSTASCRHLAHSCFFLFIFT